MGLAFWGPSAILTSIAQFIQKAAPPETAAATTGDTGSGKGSVAPVAIAPTGIAEGGSKESAVMATVAAAEADTAATSARIAGGRPAAEPPATTAAATGPGLAAPRAASAADTGGPGATSFVDRAASGEESDTVARAAAESARASFSRDQLISTVATAGQGGAATDKATVLALADVGYIEGKATSKLKAESSLARAV